MIIELLMGLFFALLFPLIFTLPFFNLSRPIKKNSIKNRKTEIHLFISFVNYR